MPEDKCSDICSVSIYSHLADLRGEHGCCQAKNKILPPDISEKVNTLLPVAYYLLSVNIVNRCGYKTKLYVYRYDLLHVYVILINFRLCSFFGVDRFGLCGSNLSHSPLFFIEGVGWCKEL